MIRRLALPILFLSLVALAFGCGEDEEKQLSITQQSVTADLHANLDSNIAGMAEALLFLDVGRARREERLET